MNKVPQYQIDELRANGIVPGATCTSAAFPNDPPFVVPPVENWRMGPDGPMSGPAVDSMGDDCNRYLKYQGRYAAVISPAPQQEGLRNNSACKPDALMRAAIVAKANELGIGEFDGSSPDENPHIQFNYGTTVRPLTHKEGSWHERLTYIPPGEFYDRLCRMTPKEKPIRIDNREVVFTGGGNIKVGCTAVEWETLEAVYERAKSTR
jgi:hypothetical protein